MGRLRSTARLALERAESVFDASFTPAWNPLYQLGALGWFFYWIVVATGIYLYIFFDTGVTDAYESVEYITNVQWYAAGVMRSLHRYASDALVVVMMLHLLREYILDRMRGPRWFAWVTGVPLLWMVFAAGLSGYWLVWDTLAQYVAVVTTEWLDTLPLFSQPIARNFLNETTLSSRLFTLMVFIHIAVPLFMLFAMWVHIYRHSRPNVNPPRGLAAGTLAALLILSLAQPAYSQGPANLGMVPAVVELDWFYLVVLPLTEHFSGGMVWMALGIATLLLVILPWLPPARRAPIAVVDLTNCNGCRRCYDDCPYGAVSMGPRTDGAVFEQQAVVDPDLCVSCGICTGACPTATPFRRRSALRAGIELPALPVDTLREICLEAAGVLGGNDRVMVFGCEHGSEIETLKNDSVGVIRLPCIAMLPPSFIDFLISRRHVEGVLLSGCRDGDCYYRLGIPWTRQRIAGERDPYLRKRVPRERLASCWVGLDRTPALHAELEAFRARLGELPSKREEADPAARAKTDEREETANHA